MAIHRQGPACARKNLHHPMTWLYALLLPTVLPAYAASTETEGAVAVSPQSREERSGVTVLPAVTVSAQRPGADTEGTGSYTTGTTKAATGLSLSPRETPQSVTVVTRQRMDDQQLNSVKDVLENTTGISSTTLDTERVSYYSRGFSIDSFQYDGVPTTYIPGSFLPGEGVLDTAFYDRVEVVRGATGLLQGVGDPSASVNLVRRRPLREFSLTGSLGAGSWDNYRGVLDVSTPLTTSGNVRARVVAAYQDRNSFLDYYQQRRQAFYGVVEADLTSSTTLSLGHEYQDSDPKGITWGGQSLFYSDGSRTDWSRSKNTAPRWSHWSNRINTTFARLEHEFDNGWSVRANAEHRRVDSSSELFSMNGYPDRASGEGLWPIALGGRSNSRQNNFDVMASGPFALFGRDHELMVGASTSRLRAHDNSAFIFPTDPIGSIYDWNGNYPKPDFASFPHDASSTTIKQTGLYSAARFSLADPLKLIIGARLSNYEMERDSSRGEPFHYKKDNKLIPYAGLVYDIDDTYSVYTSYTEIFKPQTDRDRNDKVLGPTKGKNTEVGIKGEYLDGRLNASFAVFEARLDGVPQIDSGHLLPDGSQAYYAANGTKSRGFDINVQGEIARDWNLYAGISHFTASQGDGQRLSTQIPRTTARLFTTYRLPGDWNRLTIGGGVNWQSRFYGTATGPQGEVQVGQASYALASLMARYDVSKNTTITANVNNLFDRKYYTMTGFYNHYLYGEPRNFMVNMTYKFE
ncbi:ferric-rhodotorulic acid/ferric-coprogen receptor FhuE [Pseudomonas aeruginosa]|nr:ferric-rhodotorulic acid/ferric-coprogen receptor FhuE [Pseudomonas aeruginosa]